MISTPERTTVTMTVPGEYIDDFRCAVVREIAYDGEWFRTQHVGLVDAIDRHREEQTIQISRADRAGAMKALREDAELLHQLSDDDRDVTVSGTAGTLRSVLEVVGEAWAKRLADQFNYRPVPFEGVPALLERLRWSTEQAQTLGEC